MFLSVTNTWPAFDSLVRISLSDLPSAVILDPRYVNSSTSSVFSPCSFIHLSFLVFVMLALSPIFCALVESSSVIDYMSKRRWDVRQMSSAKSRSSELSASI